MILLVYVSSATGIITPEEVSAILEASRRNNAAAGITGLLLYNGRRFLQAIEGEESAVQATYERIKSDPRHHGLAIVTSREADGRMFADWSMAARRAATDADHDDLLLQVEAMTAELAPSLRAHFLRYAEPR